LTEVKHRFGSEVPPGFLDQVWIRNILHSRHPLRDELGPIDDLVLSITEKGVLQPIVVRPVGDKFEVIAGNRRVAACRKLRLRRIPSYIVGLDDKQAYEISLIENLQRSNLNPIEEAKAFRRYVDEYGYGGVSELARRIGKSESYVSKRIGLLHLPTELQEQLIRRRITASVAEEFIHLDRAEMGEAISILRGEGTTRNEVRQSLKRLGIVRASISGDSNELVSVEESLHRVDRVTSQCIANLRTCLIRFNDAIDELTENEWTIREAYSELRRMLNESIDMAYLLKKKARSYSDFLIPSYPAMRKGTLQGTDSPELMVEVKQTGPSSAFPS
jgi:ParB family transcriptional regulator, chromosome partitioning protein